MKLRKIINLLEKIEGLKCFGCSPKNPIGLHLCFYEDGDEVVGSWVTLNELCSLPSYAKEIGVDGMCFEHCYVEGEDENA